MNRAEKENSGAGEALDADEKAISSTDRGQQASPDDAKAAARAILWAYRQLRLAPEKAPQVLAEFLSPDTIEAVETVLAKDIHGLALLQSSILTPVLEDLSECSDSEAVRTCAKRLLVKQVQPAERISFWSENRALSPPPVARGVQELGLSDNPFGPEWAERDPLLKSYGIRPTSFWDRIKGPHPILAFGTPGSGKTATAFLLAYDCGYPPANPEIEGVFPIYHLLGFNRSAKTEERSPFDPIARTLTERLLQSVARKPYLFSEQSTRGKAAMAYLMLWYLGAGSFGNLKLHLKRAGLEPRGAGIAALGELESLISDVSMDVPPDEVTLLDLLGRARPLGCDRTYILIDLGVAPNDAQAKATSAALCSILGRANYLARSETYLKVFLPKKISNNLEERIPVEAVELLWTQDDLQAMLETRLNRVDIPSLASVYSDPAGLCPDPDGRLVEAAELSPRRLVHLGNEMLAGVEEPPLRPEHLPEGKVR